MYNRFINFIARHKTCLIVPFLVGFLISIISLEFSETEIRFAIDILLTILFLFHLVFIVFILCKKLVKNQFLIWMLAVSLILLILSYIFSFVGAELASDTLFIIGIILFESYMLCIIIGDCYSEKPNIGKTVVFSLIFVSLGFYSIYLSSYGLEDKTLFNALISIFSAIVGGGVTLAGIAWTIKNGKDEKKKEEIDKAMPYFTFNVLYESPQNIRGMKVCFPEDIEFEYEKETYAEIENSDHSVVILKRIHHDKKWFSLECNNMLIHKGKLILSFRFNSFKNIILEVSDTLGNLYHYELNLLDVSLIGGTGNNIYTVRNIKKINRNFMLK